MILVNTIISVIVGALISSSFTFNFIIGFLSTLIISSVLVRILNVTVLFILQRLYYGDNIQELVDDANYASKIFDENPKQMESQQSIAEIIELTIVNTPDKKFGKFMDCEFYEWLDFKGHDNKIVRGYFKSTIDISNGISQHIPEGCILLAPGLLYQVDEPINTST